MVQTNSLFKFLSEVDNLCKSCSKEKLVNFVHELARNSPESERDNFIAMLKNSSESSDGVAKADKRYVEELLCSLRECIRVYEEDLNGTLSVLTRENIDYDHNQEISENNLEALFVDDRDCLKWINNALNIVDECFSFGQMLQAKDLSSILCGARIRLEGFLVEDLGYDEYINLWSLSTYYQLDQVLLKKFLCYCLYLDFVALKGNERNERIYNLFKASNTAEFKLTLGVLKDFKELQHFDSFVSEFIDYLSGIDTYLSRTLIDEAVMLSGKTAGVLELARRMLNTNPNLMVNLLRKGLSSDDYPHMLKVGIDAYNSIDKNMPEKIDIAVVAAEYALHLKKYELSDELYYRIFKARPTVRNYLKLRYNCSSYHKYDSQIVQAFDRAFVKKKSQSSHIDENFMMIALLDGRAELFFENSRGLESIDLPNYQSSVQYYGLIISMLMLTRHDDTLENIKELGRDVIRNVFNASVSLTDKVGYKALYDKWLSNATLDTKSLEDLALCIVDKLEKFCAQVLESNIRNLNVDVDVIQKAQMEFLSVLGLTRLKEVVAQKYQVKQIDPQALISAAMALVR